MSSYRGQEQGLKNQQNLQEYKNSDLLNSLSIKSKQIGENKYHGGNSDQNKTLRAGSPNRAFDNQATRYRSPQQSRNKRYEESEIASQKSLLSQCTHSPKISKRSKELAEENFKKMREQKDSNYSNLTITENGRVPDFFLYKSQETQTNVTYKDDHQKQSFQIYKKVKPAVNPNQKKCSKAVNNEAVNNEESEDQNEKITISTQTDEKEGQKTPEPKKKSSIANNSGSKKTYYVPIYERCQYVIQAKKDHLDSLRQSQLKTEQIALNNKKQSIQISRHEDYEDPQERIQNFLEKQEKWLKRKQNKIISEQMKKTQVYETKMQDQDKEDDKQLNQKINLSQKSRHLADRHVGSMDFLSRLTFYDDRKKQRLFELSDYHRECTFAPQLSPQSRCIVMQQMEREQGNYSQYQ